MNRRDTLKSIALALGGTFSAPTLFAMDRWQNATGVKSVFADFIITDNQKKIVAEVAEMIIPKTDTPGAGDAGVPAFIIMMLQDCYKEPEHLSFLDGVKKLEQSQFLSLDLNQKMELLKTVEKESVEQMKAYQVQQTKMGDNEDREQMATQVKGVPFWRLIKELTMLGYFTSEPAIMSSYIYTPIPGKLEMIKMKPNQKSYAY